MSKLCDDKLCEDKVCVCVSTQSYGGCRQVPRLPCKVKVLAVHVAKRHACHAKRRGATASHLKPSAPPEPDQCHACHACHAK